MEGTHQIKWELSFVMMLIIMPIMTMIIIMVMVIPRTQVFLRGPRSTAHLPAK